MRGCYPIAPMRAFAVLLLALLHAGAASVPCAPGAAPEPAREAGYAALALHPTHAPVAARDAGVRELRAACPCGCAHAPAASGVSPLPPALPRAVPALAQPADTAPLAASAEPTALARGSAPDPVPRVA